MNKRDSSIHEVAPYDIEAAMKEVIQDPFNRYKDDVQRHMEALFLVVSRVNVSHLKEVERDALRDVCIQKIAEINQLGS